MTPSHKLIATRLSPHFREVAEVIEDNVPDPGPGELLVRNRYAGVNATDVNIAAGRYSANPTLPLDLGAEAVGIVEAVGEGVTGFTVGQAVGTMGVGGGYREVQLVQAKHAVPVPEASPEWVSLFVSGLTASIGLSVTGEMATGETVLVTTAAGGTGQYAVQLAKLAGNTVIGTCGSDDKADFLRAIGCDRPVNYRTEVLGDVLREAAPRGLNLVYECVGGAMFDTAVQALAVGGRLVSIGYVGEYVDGVERVTAPRVYTHLLQKSASVRGFFLPHFVRHYPEHLARLAGLMASGKLRVEVDPTVFEGVGAAVDAVEYLHSGQSRGKVVVRLS
ncbi:MAG TPA: zinc-binding dehydrogenase [Rubricoccaceae bacterium]|jgi:hypothetical protein